MAIVKLSVPFVLADSNGDTKALFSPLTATAGKDPLLAWINPGLSKMLRDNLKGKKKDDDPFENLDTLRTYWESLLLSALHFLKINDQRERAYLKDHSLEEKDRWEDDNKTTWKTPGADRNQGLNVYGFGELNEYFREFSAFESMLYGAERFYRDHLQHPLRVWLIGLNILRSNATHFSLRVSPHAKIEDASFARPEWRQHPGDDDLPISAAEVGAMWTVAALTHDLGYPLEKVERINDQLERMLSKFGKIDFARSRFSFQTQHDHLVRILLQLISSVTARVTDANGAPEWQTRARAKYHAKFSKSWEMFDHGIVSALILLKALTYFLESDCSFDRYGRLDREDARQFAVRAEILHTVATHTTARVYHLSAANLPFLLVLCDELQEWRRPTMSEMREGRLTGTAATVEINQCDMPSRDRSTIECTVSYSGRHSRDEQRAHARRVFRAWHERLRPAVDDADRHMSFTWNLRFEEEPRAWSFKLDSQAPVFNQIAATDPDNKAFEFWIDGE
jgi:hypothetical protein